MKVNIEIECDTIDNIETALSTIILHIKASSTGKNKTRDRFVKFAAFQNSSSYGIYLATIKPHKYDVR